MLLITGATLGCVFMLAAAFVAPSFARLEPQAGKAAPAVTLLKPLYGDEPELYANLASFCRQDYAGPIQIVFGVTNRHDPAIAVVERLRAEFPGSSSSTSSSTDVSAAPIPRSPTSST